MRIFDLINAIPPSLCRLLARKANGHRSLTIREIAQRSGISKSTVAEISVRTSWQGIDIDVVERYATACGVDFTNVKRHHEFLCKGKKNLLFLAPPSQRKALTRIVLNRRTQLNGGQTA